MRFVEFNGDKISKLSLGTVQFGLEYGIANTRGKPLQKDVNEIVSYVTSHGINCLDTAQAYGNSEKVIGKAIEDKNDLFIVSKLKTDLFKNNLNQNIDTSLDNLNISTLYGLLLHDSELLFSWNKEEHSKVKQLKEENKIKHFGVSIYTDEEFNLAVENSDIDIIQIPFNLFDQRAITKNWLQKAKEKNKLIFIRSVFLQGLFFMDKEKLPQKLSNARELLSVFETYTNKLELTKAQLALNFVNSVAKDSILLFGCDSLDQAKENIDSFNNLMPLSNHIIDELIFTFKNVDEQIYNPSRW